MKIERPKSKYSIPENAKKVFKGKIFDVYQWEQEMYDGSNSTFEKLKRPDTVVIFPILPDGKILLLEQEQPGREAFLGTPGGRVDEGENILDAIKRELLEETGYEAEEFFLWDAQQPVSKIEWAVYTFIAKGLRKVAEMNPDSGEKIKLMPVSFDDLINIAADNKFSEREVVTKFIEAKYDTGKRKELEKLFKP
jgi:ADP-ribose pyrophosphatase YjhB (NUDIX family)